VFSAIDLPTILAPGTLLICCTALVAFTACVAAFVAPVTLLAPGNIDKPLPTRPTPFATGTQDNAN
jgi:hypothetical protein